MELIHSQPARAPFSDPHWTADGSPRARVALRRLETLWFCTGTLCNLACESCYIESSPSNDALAYLTRAEVSAYLEEIDALRLGTSSIGFTGGEPFMNPDLPGMLEDVLGRGYEALVLTNAMRPMMKRAEALRALGERYGDRLAIRVSVDHFDPDTHESERGRRSWRPMVEGMAWLAANGFRLHVAGRTRWGEDEETLRAGFAELFATYGIPVDAWDPSALMLFPEMDDSAAVPEITTGCWAQLGKSPDDIMCASSRMVVKRKGAARPAVVACTLLPYDPRFELGPRLADALGEIPLNHVHCSKFCVLGGGSCGAP